MQKDVRLKFKRRAFKMQRRAFKIQKTCVQNAKRRAFKM